MVGKRVHVGESNRRILEGEDDLADWDDEELWRGRKRDKGGAWRGRPPELVPRSVHEELNRRKFNLAHEELNDAVVDAVRYQVSVLKDENADPALRMRAAENITERVLGKPIDRAQVEVSLRKSPWEEVLVHAIVGTDSEVIDAEVVEAEEPIIWDDR